MQQRPEGQPSGEPGSDPTAATKWWLKMQIGLGIGGGAVWFLGTLVEQNFIAGLGFGLIASALILRIGRAAADEA